MENERIYSQYDGTVLLQSLDADFCVYAKNGRERREA